MWKISSNLLSSSVPAGWEGEKKLGARQCGVGRTRPPGAPVGYLEHRACVWGWSWGSHHKQSLLEPCLGPGLAPGLQVKHCGGYNRTAQRFLSIESRFEGLRKGLDSKFLEPLWVLPPEKNQGDLRSPWWKAEAAHWGDVWDFSIIIVITI